MKNTNCGKEKVANNENVVLLDAGSCGESANYQAKSDGTLVISGSGAVTEQIFLADGVACDKIVIGEDITSLEPKNSSGEAAALYKGRIKSVTFGENALLSAIGSAVFSGCPLEEATIPVSMLEHITKRNLKKVVLTESEKSIGKRAFSGCVSLTNVVIPSGITDIGEEAFYYCRSLTSINIPDTVTKIEAGVFTLCEKLESITVDSNNTVYKSEGNCLIEKRSNTLIAGCKTSVIPNYVTGIGERAFSNCRSLTSIKIPSSVTSIGEWAFQNCTSLTIYCEVTSQLSGWDNNWKSNSTPVVWNCKNNDIADDGNIYYVADNGIRYAIKDGVATVAGQSILLSGDIVIPSSVTYKDTAYSVTSIGIIAFYDCSSLTSIVIPNSITSVGAKAFYGCYNLQYYEYDNALYLGNRDNPYLVLVKAKNEDITSCEINVNTKIIYSTAFSNCKSLTSIEIPSSVTSIGILAFADCSSLANITVDSNNAVYKSDSNCIIEKSSNTLVVGCGNSVIPTCVTTIGKLAFAYCNTLTTIEIPSNVTCIYSDAFQCCLELRSITFENTKGWYNAKDLSATKGKRLNVTKASRNVLNLTLDGSYWKRK